MTQSFRYIFATLSFLIVTVLMGVSGFAQDSTPDVPPAETETTAAIPVDEQAVVEELEQAENLSEDEALLLELARKKIETDRAYYKALTEATSKSDGESDETLAESETGAEEAGFLDPENLKAMALDIWDKIVSWLTSASFLAMVGAIVISFFLAPILAKQLRRRLFFFRDEPKDGIKLKIVWDYVYRARNFLRAAVFVLLLAVAAILLEAIPAFGENWLVKIAQSIAVVFLLYKAIKEFIPNDLFRKLATWVAIPLALVTVMGGLPELITWLETTPVIPMGDTPITAMTIIRLGIFGALFFWLGNMGNTRGQDAIRSQETLDVATREIVAKLFQMILFVIVVILVMSFAGIPLSGLVMIMSAIGLGIGLGLQPIAANFVSGIIILFDRSVRQGDFVVLPDGQEGFVEAINMRSTTVETTDGKDIMVPNTTFIENTYENWTHKDPRQRYEVHFSVAYDTDIDKLEDILIPAISAYDKVLMEPEEPDLELREFGENGINFAIEFWCSGIDDGPNKFTSDLNFIVWRALKKAGIVMPLPQREVRNLK